MADEERTRHEQRYVALKHAWIDEPLVDIVVWLNTYKGIFTVGCCQGQGDGNLCRRPRISFRCFSDGDLKDVLGKAGASCKMEVKPLDHQLMYFLEFYDFDAIERLNRRLTQFAVKQTERSEAEAKNG